MKKIYVLFVFAFISLQQLQAQIGINTTNPDPSSMLDITSTDSGILIPRMTEAQRDAITAPVKGLLIFQIDETEGFYYWDGITWIPFGGSGTGEFISESGVVHNTTDVQSDDFVFGSTQLDNTGATSTDHRMFYDKALAAFRAGESDDVQWDNVNLGLHSTATGKNTIASARSSVAMGEESIAAGNFSIALGHNAIITTGSSSAVAIGSGATATDNNAVAIGEDTEASETNATAMGNATIASGKNSFAVGNATEAQGNSSTALGKQTVASGDNSFAMGVESVASGRTSTAIGDEVTAPSYGELTVGIFNETYVAASATSRNNNDRIFSVGNGVSNLTRRNALTILKNGNTGIGTTAPSATLDVEGTIEATSMTATGRITANDFEASLSSTIYADYVFEDFYDGYSKINPNYKFKTIEETEKFVKENGHLPGVVSYKEIMRNGNTINLSETSINNLEKIEEQFLYITTLNKTLEEHQESIKALNEKLAISKSNNIKLENLIKTLNQKLNQIIENYSIDIASKKQ